jgi:hypothetical protein
LRNGQILGLWSPSLPARLGDDHGETKICDLVVALLPQYVDRLLGHVPFQFAVLGVILIGLEILFDGTVALTAGRIGDWLSRRRRARKHLTPERGHDRTRGKTSQPPGTLARCGSAAFKTVSAR